MRGTFSISLSSRCRRRRSWCSQPFLFPGGTATAVDLARTTEKTFRGRSFRRRHLLFNHFHLPRALEVATATGRPTRHSAATVVPPPRSARRRLLISLATYNEAGNLRPLVETSGSLHRRCFDPDHRRQLARRHGPDRGRAASDHLRDIHVIHRAGKLGLGTATLAAIGFAIEHKYDYLLNLDADFSHPPRFIPDLLAGMADHDVMIGSRYVPGGGVEGGFTLKRRLMSGGINVYARLLLGLNSKDNSGAFRCYRVSKLAEIDLSRVRSRGYSFQEEILYWCQTVGCRIGETPILFENRRAGSSKINMREAVSALWILLQLAISRPFRRR